MENRSFTDKAPLVPCDGMDVAGGARTTGDALRRDRARWVDAATWAGGDLRREVFFFRSRGVDLYGSIYAASRPSLPLGVVACSSWGVEADRCDPLQRSVAAELARRGGAGMVFHYPGHGDSFGDLAGVRLSDLAEAACDAVDEASRRCPGLRWMLAGFMFGASVACLAHRRADAKKLLLVQPELSPGDYFRRLARATKPIAPGPSPRRMLQVGEFDDMAYGYPIPRLILDSAEEADSAVASALAVYEGEGAVVRHAEPAPDLPPPAGFPCIEVPGIWRFGAENHLALAEAAREWLAGRSGR